MHCCCCCFCCYGCSVNPQYTLQCSLQLKLFQILILIVFHIIQNKGHTLPSLLHSTLTGQLFYVCLACVQGDNKFKWGYCITHVTYWYCPYYHDLSSQFKPWRSLVKTKRKNKQRNNLFGALPSTLNWRLWKKVNGSIQNASVCSQLSPSFTTTWPHFREWKMITTLGLGVGLLSFPDHSLNMKTLV